MAKITAKFVRRRVWLETEICAGAEMTYKLWKEQYKSLHPTIIGVIVCNSFRHLLSNS